MPRKPRDLPDFQLVQQSGRANWYIWWSEGGRSRRISTGTADKARAQLALADHIAGWQSPPPPTEITVSHALDEYLRWKKTQVKAVGDPERNYKELEYTLAPVRAEIGPLTIGRLTRQRGRTLIGDWQKAGLSNGTIRKRLNILSAALNHARKEGWITTVPHMDKPSSPPSRDKWLTEEQVRDFTASIQTPHVKLFTLLALHTLSRKSAILELTWDRVDLERRFINFNVPGRLHAVKRRAEVPIVSKALYAALEQAAEFRLTEHVIEYNGHPGGDLARSFRKVAKEAKMEWVTPHVLRHTGATIMAMRGASMYEIAQIMGDTVTTVSTHYLKYCPEHLKGALGKLDEAYG